jgi:elongation factor 1 alpha-like protein
LEVGFLQEEIIFVPISGLAGENLIAPSEDPNLKKWWKGECLIDILDKLKIPTREINKPLRVTVMDYIQKSQG